MIEGKIVRNSDRDGSLVAASAAPGEVAASARGGSSAIEEGIRRKFSVAIVMANDFRARKALTGAMPERKSPDRQENAGSGIDVPVRNPASEWRAADIVRAIAGTGHARNESESLRFNAASEAD